MGEQCGAAPHPHSFVLTEFQIYRKITINIMRTPPEIYATALKELMEKKESVGQRSRRESKACMLLFKQRWAIGVRKVKGWIPVGLNDLAQL